MYIRMCILLSNTEPQMETKNLPIYQVRGVTPQTKKRLYLGGCSLRSIKTVIISGLVSINGAIAKKK